MSVRKPARDHKRSNKTIKRARRRTAAITADAIEGARLELLGVHALIEVVSYRLPGAFGMVLTRGALLPTRRVLALLGGEDVPNPAWEGRLDAACSRRQEVQR